MSSEKVPRGSLWRLRGSRESPAEPSRAGNGQGAGMFGEGFEKGSGRFCGGQEQVPGQMLEKGSGVYGKVPGLLQVLECSR